MIQITGQRLSLAKTFRSLSLALPVCPQPTIDKMLNAYRRHSLQSRAMLTPRVTPVFSHSASLSRLRVPADLIPSGLH